MYSVNKTRLEVKPESDQIFFYSNYIFLLCRDMVSSDPAHSLEPGTSKQEDSPKPSRSPESAVIPWVNIQLLDLNDVYIIYKLKITWAIVVLN